MPHDYFLDTHVTPQAGSRMARGTLGLWAVTACGIHLVLQALNSQVRSPALDRHKAEGSLRNHVFGVIGFGVFGGDSALSVGYWYTAQLRQGPLARAVRCRSQPWGCKESNRYL